MKKLLLIVASLAVSLSAFGQVATTRSFLNATSITVSNTVSITNLIAVGVTGTNVTGTVWTNLSGTQIVSNGTTNGGDNLLKTINLWADRNGSYMPTTYAISTGTNATAQTGPFAKNIFIRVVGGSGANTATAFVFAPVPSDTGVEDTTAADLISVSVTPAGATQVTSLTPLNEAKLIGVRALRLISVTAGDTDASSQVTVLECSLNGFAP